MALPRRGDVQPVEIVDSSGNPARVSSIAGVFRLAVDAVLSGSGVAVPNRSSFATGQNDVAVAGTAEQVGTQVIPDGFSVVVKAKNTNTGRIRVGNSAANAQNSAVAFTLGSSDSIRLFITNLDLVWIDATVSGEGVEWIVET